MRHVEAADDPHRPVEARLPDLIASLATPRERIEAAFLSVGTQLGEAAVRLNRIVAAFELLPRDLDGDAMWDATARLEAFSARVRDIASGFTREQREVARLLAAIESATNPVMELRRSVRTMGILAVNARIVAAGLADAADQFEVFTTDIAELSGSATRTVAAFVADHARLAEAVHAAAGQFTTFEAAHRDKLATLADLLERRLAEVERRRRLSAGHSAETARLSREIADRVGGAVMALQVGDSTRQRVQHNEENLASLAAWLRGETEGGVEVGGEAREMLAATVLDLQRAQLRATGEAFTEETADAERALAELAVDAEAAIASCRKLYGSGELGESPIAALGTLMREAATLLRDCAVERARLDELAREVGEMVELLLGHVTAVEDIEANMRLVGLNAAVKCAQLGPRGASLSVIAAQLRELTRELVPAAQLAVTRLEEATRIAHAFRLSTSGHGATEVAELETAANEALALVGTVDIRLATALAALDRDGRESVDFLADASQGLLGHANIAEALADAEMEIAALAGGTSGQPKDLAAIAAPLQVIRKRYSTQAERLLHDARLAAAGLPDLPGTAETGSSPQAAAADEDAALDALLF